MEQPWNQQREGSGGFAMGEGSGGFAMGEGSRHAADLDQAAMMTDPCEVDGALLMELMDQDLPTSDLILDGDVDCQLSHVIRSLEAEIGAAGDQQAVMMMADDAGEAGLQRIDNVFSDDMDGYDYEGASSFLVGHDEAEGWCVYTNNGYEGGGVLGYDTTVDHQYYYTCVEASSADHMSYLPLWE